MLTNLRPALVITRREIADHLRDWRIVSPLTVLVLLLPFLMNYLSNRLIGLASQYGQQVKPDQLFPFLLMVVGFFPITVALILALESFVGEKERRSLEPLLSSPLSDSQVYLGKLLAALIPPLLTSYAGMSVYLIFLSRQSGWIPGLTLVFQVFLLASVNCLVMVSAAIVISSQTTSMRAANLMAMFIIIPMAVLLQGQSAVIVWSNERILWLTVSGLVIIAVLLIRTGLAHFNREELIGRDLDALDIRWGWRTFWKEFIGQARSPFEWYRKELPRTLKDLRLPAFLIVIVLSTAILIGSSLARRFAFPVELIDHGTLRSGSFEGFESIRFFEIGSIPLVWFHNLRALFLATMLGIPTFGVLAVIVLMFPLTLIGFFSATAAAAGISPWLFLVALVLPHGVLEIPAIILGGAAILRLGAILAAPTCGKTIGEVWIRAFADWTRVMVSLVAPLLLGAAILEVTLTPKLALWFFSG